jgi:hypothetical protein
VGDGIENCLGNLRIRGALRQGVLGPDDLGGFSQEGGASRFTTLSKRYPTALPAMPDVVSEYPHLTPRQRCSSPCFQPAELRCPYTIIRADSLAMAL